MLRGTRNQSGIGHMQGKYLYSFTTRPSKFVIVALFVFFFFQPHREALRNYLLGLLTWILPRFLLFYFIFTYLDIISGSVLRDSVAPGAEVGSVTCRVRTFCIISPI